jgi:hypothetical protein
MLGMLEGSNYCSAALLIFYEVRHSRRDFFHSIWVPAGKKDPGPGLPLKIPMIQMELLLRYHTDIIQRCANAWAAGRGDLSCRCHEN